MHEQLKSSCAMKSAMAYNYDKVGKKKRIQHYSWPLMHVWSVFYLSTVKIQDW